MQLILLSNTIIFFNLIE